MFTLQPYKSSDAPLLQGIFSKQELAKYTNRGGYKILSLFGVYKSQFMLLKRDEQLVGCGVIRRKYSRDIRRRSWWLYAIWIHPDHRGHGYGSILMEKLLCALRNLHVKQVYLVVANDNVRAQNLYHKMGFTLYQQQLKDKILRYEL
ncbi:MAG: GNAT family N-acetyltransferase [Paludibacteraceae bacterium]|nr:GNAT family N-acetyltransferase [Paludibacteraceae bacterium]